MNCVHKSKAENAEKNSNHEFWRKKFCFVAIIFTSPKISVTASKQVHRRDKMGGGGGGGGWNYIKLALRFLKLDWLIFLVYMYISFGFSNIIFLLSMCNIVRLTKALTFLGEKLLFQFLWNGVTFRNFYEAFRTQLGVFRAKIRKVTKVSNLVDRFSNVL